MAEVDELIMQQCLKKWAARQSPPADARSRLLATAAQLRAEKAIHHYNSIHSPLPFLFTSSGSNEASTQPYVWFIRMSMTPLKVLT